MTAAYKIALAAAATLLVLVLALLLLGGDGAGDAAAPTADGGTAGSDGAAGRGIPDLPRNGAEPQREPTVTFGEAILPGDGSDTPGGGGGDTLTLGRTAAGSDPFEMQASPLYADPRPLPGAGSPPRSRDEAIDELEPDSPDGPDVATPDGRGLVLDAAEADDPTATGRTLGPTDPVDRMSVSDFVAANPIPPIPADPVPTSFPVPPPPAKQPPPKDPAPGIAERPATTHTIASGETFSSLAAKLYGDQKYWVAISQANPLIDPERLRVGQEIRLPDPAEVSGDAAPAKSDLPEGRTSYTVKSGDSLSEIAQQFYGKATQWRRIHDANRALIGSDPADLRAGMKLVIPPPNEGAR